MGEPVVSVPDPGVRQRGVPHLGALMHFRLETRRLAFHSRLFSCCLCSSHVLCSVFSVCLSISETTGLPYKLGVPVVPVLLITFHVKKMKYFVQEGRAGKQVSPACGQTVSLSLEIRFP